VTGWSPALLTGGVVRTCGAMDGMGGVDGEGDSWGDGAGLGAPFWLVTGAASWPGLPPGMAPSAAGAEPSVEPVGGAEPSGVAPGVLAELPAGTGGALLMGGAEVAEPSAAAGGMGASWADTGGVTLRTTIAPRAVSTPKRTFFKRPLLAAEPALCQQEKTK
jgi:hypothetical protein